MRERTSVSPRLAVTLSDLSSRSLTILYHLRARRGWYSVLGLVQQHGGVKLADLLVTLAKCQRANSSSI
jgi:hypothetical protein